MTAPWGGHVQLENPSSCRTCALFILSWRQLVKKFSLRMVLLQPRLGLCLWRAAGASICGAKRTWRLLRGRPRVEIPAPAPEGERAVIDRHCVGGRHVVRFRATVSISFHASRYRRLSPATLTQIYPVLGVFIVLACLGELSSSAFCTVPSPGTFSHCADRLLTFGSALIVLGL